MVAAFQMRVPKTDSKPKNALCVCLCMRPVMLRRRPDAISKLIRPEGADAPVIALDNEIEPNGQPIAEEFGAVYVHEPRRGIAKARNAAIEAALALEPDFIAFIDDDEYPQPDWLMSILRIQAEYRADVAASRVVPAAVWQPSPALL